MPGLVGLITSMPSAWAEEQLALMLRTQLHADFYVSGKWSQAEMGVYAGWTAHRESFASQMPISSPAGDVTLLFAGEEFSGCSTSSGNPTTRASAGYLLDCYQKDRKFLGKLNGVFHGLIVDANAGSAMLFNDRYGMHPFYYHQSRDAFFFSTEAKAILAVCPELRAVDPKGLGEFIAFSCVLENRTIFKDIRVLPGGSAWIFQNGQLAHKNSYFCSEEWENQEPLAPEQYREALSEVLQERLPRYFGGAQRIGIALTGGLDTRLIMGLHAAQPGSLNCFTFTGPLRESQDVIIARRVAQQCEQPYQPVTVERDFLDNFSQYLERSVYLSEGTVDAYRASDLYLSEKVRKISPVKIVGTYGSEIVQHAVMFKPARFAPGLFAADMHSYLLDARSTYSQVRSCHPITFAAFRQSPWYHRGILALEQTQLTVRSPFLDNDFVRTVYRAPAANDSSGSDIRLRILGEHASHLAGIRSDRGVIYKENGLARIKRFALETSFKGEYFFDSGMPGWFTRLNRLIPAAISENLFLGRHKLLHFRMWYRNQLNNYLKAVLLDPRSLSRSYAEPKGIEQVVRGHISGTGNYTTEIHKLLTLELLHRLFIDKR
jgi:asparagine synthase (glutamine-hydrolysing)